MKKRLLLIAAVLLIANVAFGQGLKKGNLIGIHRINVITLKPNVTMDQFETFYAGQVLPEYEKAWVGLKGYLLRPFKDKNSFAIVWLFESEAARNRYFTAEDKASGLEIAAREKVKLIEEELKKYSTYSVDYKNDDDWVVR
ncbi:MAG: hypothetical protein ABI878_02970 [Acidobacteriota bacterium]